MREIALTHVASFEEFDFL